MEKIKCSVKTSGYNNIYDKTINPQMMTEFSGCAFRYMHSTITEKVRYVSNSIGKLYFEWEAISSQVLETIKIVFIILLCYSV